jgi:hypothetical protein
MAARRYGTTAPRTNPPSGHCPTGFAPGPCASAPTRNGPSDWLHEREWRIPRPDGPLALEPAAVKAIIVGSESWTPELVNTPVEVPGFPNAFEGDFDTIGLVTELRPLPPLCWAGKPRWLWRPGHQDFLELPPV